MINNTLQKKPPTTLDLISLCKKKVYGENLSIDFFLCKIKLLEDVFIADCSPNSTKMIEVKKKKHKGKEEKRKQQLMGLPTNARSQKTDGGAELI